MGIFIIPTVTLMSISDMFYQLMKLKLLCLITILLLNSNFARAEIQSQYFVGDVLINASGKSPSQARINAIASGQRNAFIILLNRLGIDENLANGFKDDIISDMVASQQIMDEKIAGNNYSATLNLNFSDSFVKHHLGGHLGGKIESAQEKKPNSYLVIPIKIIQNETLIWGENNDWKLTWENIIKNNQTLPIKLPKGDIEDIGIFNNNAVNEDKFLNFESSLNKYKVEALVLAYFEFDAIENKVNIHLKTIRKFQNNQVHLDFINVNQLEMPDLINKVANKTLDYLIADKTSAEPNEINLSIDVLISNLGDWVEIKNKLENSNIVSGLKVSSISKSSVKINVTYNKNNGNIINFFAKHNLLLQKRKEGEYSLSTKLQLIQ